MEELLKEIEPFVVERCGNVRIDRRRMYVMCVRASFRKAFDLCVSVNAIRAGAVPAFFVIGSLRSICEDVIVLAYMRGIPRVDRERLVALRMHYDLQQRMIDQRRFFDAWRPDQPVPGRALAVLEAEKRAAKEEMQAIWRRNGWPNLQRNEPPVREMAERVNSEMLAVGYDFLYRLASSLVHYSPHVLLRSGWGRTRRAVAFSSFSFNGYHLALIEIYGPLLLTLYFDLFPRWLRPSKQVLLHVGELRHQLLMTLRWPEIVTFEELNRVPPRGEVLRLLARIHDAERRRARILS